MDSMEQDVKSKFRSCSTDDRISIYLQCINLLKCIHDNGVYHGDARLENFMYDYDGTIMAIDFETSGFITEDMATKVLPFGTIEKGPPGSNRTIMENAKLYDLYRLNMLAGFYFDTDFIDAIPKIWELSDYTKSIYDNDRDKFLSHTEYESICERRKGLVKN